MKRACISLLLVIALVCAACPSALAAVRMPSGTGATLAANGWNDYTALSLADITPEPLDGRPTDTAAVMNRTRRTVLFVFQYDPAEQAYALDVAARYAVYQNDRAPSIAYNVEEQELTYVYEARRPAEGRPKREAYFFGRDGDGVWRFQRACIVYQSDGKKGEPSPWYWVSMDGDVLHLELDWRDGVEEDSPVVFSEGVRSMPREAWVYDLHTFDLAQIFDDIAFLAAHEGEALLFPPPPIAGAPAQAVSEGPEGSAAAVVAAAPEATPGPVAAAALPEVTPEPSPAAVTNIQVGTQTVHADTAAVDLASWGLSDIGPLAALRAPETLDLSFNDIADLQPLAGLGSLRSLNLSHNRIEDISPLWGMGRLETLRLAGNPLTDLQPLTGCPALKNLTLSGEITDLSPLAGLSRLTALTATGSPLADLGPLAELPQLATLMLDNNQIVDIRPLHGATNLVWLSLQQNAIADLRPAANLKALRHLDLSDNQIRDVSPLGDLKRLTRLNLSGNRVSDLAPLKDLRAMVYLDLSDNQVSDLTPLKWMPNLQELRLDGNPPEGMDLMQLYGLQKLRLIHLPHDIPDDQAVALARRLPKCTVVRGQ